MQFDDLLLQRIGLGAVAPLPQDGGEVAHRPDTVRMLFPKFLDHGCNNEFEELVSPGEIPLRRDGSGEVLLATDVCVINIH